MLGRYASAGEEARKPLIEKALGAARAVLLKNAK